MSEERKEKFTPGPWRSELTRIYPPERDVIVSSWDDKTPFEEAVANAALIAAAPEMYYLLDELTSDIRHLLQSKNPDMGRLILNKIEATLEKARGEE